MLSSEGVHNVQFSTARKGYQESEVDAFLDLVVDAIDERDGVIAELRTAAEAFATAQRPAVDAGAHAEPETSLLNGDAAARLLVLAEKTSADCIADAQAHAAETIRVAQEHAADITTAAKESAARSTREADERRQQILGALYDEQQRLRAELTELRNAFVQSCEQVERHAADLLAVAHADSAAPHHGNLRILSA